MSSAAASLDPSIVPHPDVAIFRCRSCASGYRNVYECSRADGLTKYVAKVKLGGRLRCLRGSRSYQPHVSALAVVRWYQDTFGDAWRDVAAQRKALAGLGSAGGAVRLWYSPARGAWLAAVWLDGKRTEVVPLGPDGKPDPDADEPETFPTPEKARAGVRGFVAAVTGQRRSPRLWRTTPPVARHPAASSRVGGDDAVRPEGIPA